MFLMSTHYIYGFMERNIYVATQLAFYVNLHRAVIGPSATLTGRWRPDIDLRRMLTGYPSCSATHTKTLHALPPWDAGVILEGDFREKVSLSWLTSSYLELREKWKCIECIGKSKIWTKSVPWNPEIVSKLLPLWKLQDDPCWDVFKLFELEIYSPAITVKVI